MNTRRHYRFHLVFFALALSCFLDANAQLPVNNQPLPKSKRSALNAQFLQRSGGFIKKPTQGKAFVFINAQKRTLDPFFTVSNDIENILRISVQAVEEQPNTEPLIQVNQALQKSHYGAAILLCDVSSLPGLLIAPEQRWAVVNVAKLAEDNPSKALLAERTHKELWRAFAYLMGAAHTTMTPCLLKTITSIHDLDANTAKIICPEPLQKIVDHAQKLGIQPVERTTYKRACEEGWAPMPTNALQRAIWEEVKNK